MLTGSHNKAILKFHFFEFFFTDVCYNEFPQIHAQIYPTPENSTFWIHIVKLPKIGRPNPQQTYYPPPPLKFSGFLGLWCPPFLCSTLYTYPKSSLTRNMWLVMKDLKPHLSRFFFYWRLVASASLQTNNLIALL